jgi:putative phosphoribosyl transferase
MEKFIDRQEAGKFLAGQLKEYAKDINTIVLALPRGGVPVAYEIAKALFLPLEVVIVRKLGVPGHEELALGAIASGGTVIFNEEIIQSLHIPPAAIQRVIREEEKELQRRELMYRGKRPFPNLQDKNVILVDDGIATGATLRAAIKSLCQRKPRHIVVAVPVAARSTCEEMIQLVDRLVCPLQPTDFYAVGVWYENFSQTTDAEVSELLVQANSPPVNNHVC